MKKNNRINYDAKRALVKKGLAKDFNCTEQNVGKAINGHSTTEQSLAIAKEYKIRYEKLQKALA